MFYDDDDDTILPFLSLGPYLMRRKIQEEMNKKEEEEASTSRKMKNKPTDSIVIKVGVSMGRFFNKKELSDVKLKVGDKVFDAHKIVVVSASDVFEAMLMNEKWQEASKQEIELQDDNAEDFAMVLKFLYTGRICLHIKKIMSVYHIADKYNLKVLKLALCKFLHKFVTQRKQQGKLTCPEAIAICNAFESDTLMHPGLKSVIQWIGTNFNNFIKSSEWESLPRRTILMILQKDEIGDNEQKIFAAAKRWLQYDDSRTETPELIFEVLQHVRLTILSARDLYTIENDPIVIRCPQMVKLVSDTIRRKFYEGVPNFIGESVKPKWLKRRERNYSNSPSCEVSFSYGCYYGDDDDYFDDEDEDYSDNEW